MKKKLFLLIALTAIMSELSLFANFFTQGSCCPPPPPAYYQAGSCQKPRCCRNRLIGKPRWACCEKKKCWSLRRWLFGDPCCRPKRQKRTCCWPNEQKVCPPTPCTTPFETYATTEPCSVVASAGVSYEEPTCNSYEYANNYNTVSYGQYQDTSYPSYNPYEYTAEQTYSSYDQGNQYNSFNNASLHSVEYDYNNLETEYLDGSEF